MDNEGDVSYAIKIKEGIVEFNIICESSLVATGEMHLADSIQLAKNILNTLGDK